MILKDALERLLAGTHLAEDEACALVHALTEESTPAALAGALLVALRAKGEVPAELRGLARGLRERARSPLLDGSHAVDIVGTGGDGSGSLNLSTGAALLTAACGQAVVKHGNRALSSRAGSADVLEALGLALPLDETRAGACFAATKFTFLFAPYYHPAMATLAGVRRALGVRTVFNVLGPLCNPALPAYAVIGAYDLRTADLMASALAGMPIKRAFVVHGEPGWDEPTPVGPFALFDVRRGEVRTTRRDPRSIGIARCEPQALAGGDATHNAARLRGVLTGEERGAHRDALALGCALALEVAGAARDWRDGLVQAHAAIDSGRAAGLIDRIGRGDFGT
jgi:anthranilate phosphoribosyltransferase